MKTIPEIPELQWCRYYSAVDGDGRPVDAENPTACAWCVTGWLDKHFNGAEIQAMHDIMIEVIMDKCWLPDTPLPLFDFVECYEHLAFWNDCNHTDVGMVNEFIRAVNEKLNDA